MPKIRFLQNRVVQDGLQGTVHETRFSTGQVVELAEASAAHWLSRGVAERVVEAAASEPPAPQQQQQQGGLDLTGGSDQAEEPGEDNGEDGEGSEDPAAGVPAELERRPAKSKAAAKA